MPSSSDQDPPVLISACLLGTPCRYDGGHCLREPIVSLRSCGVAIPICPEEMGGLPTPRAASTLVGGDGNDVLDGQARVVNRDGDDVTDQFLTGARISLERAREAGAVRALLKAGSPSCGCDHTNVDRVRRPGRGVAAALLAREGIEVEEID